MAMNMPGMSMDTSSTSTTTTAAATSSSTSTVSSMPMAMAPMTFFQASNTPLLFDVWVPDSVAAYAGTCLFIVVLAAATRTLFAARARLEHSIWARAPPARTKSDKSHDEQSRGRAFHRLPEEGNNEAGLLHGDAEAQKTSAVGWLARLAMPSRLLQGLLEAVLTCLSYLLMLAVMTMNVGYFLSVLGGVFIGTVMLGRRATTAEWQIQHC